MYIVCAVCAECIHKYTRADWMHLLALEFVCRKSVFLHICLHHQLPSFWPSAWTYIAYVVGTLFSRTAIPIISDCNCELAFFCRHHLGASTLECFTFVSSRLSVCFCVNWIIISLARHLSAHNRFVFADCLLLNGSSVSRQTSFLHQFVRYPDSAHCDVALLSCDNGVAILPQGCVYSVFCCS